MFNTIHYFLKLYVPQYAWLVETLYYPIGMLQINFAKKTALTKMLEELDWEEHGHWAYNKYKNRIEERLHFLDNHSI